MYYESNKKYPSTTYLIITHNTTQKPHLDSNP